MVKFTDSDINSMSLEDLHSLMGKIKLAEKTKRSTENEKLAGTLSVGDKIEFSVPKTDKTEVAIVAKVKRVMIALKSPTSPTVQWNVPLTSIIKVIESAPVKKVTAKKSPTTSKKATPKKTVDSKKKTVKKNIVKTSKASETDVKPTVKKSPPKKETDSNTKSLIAAIKAKAAAKRAASSAPPTITTKDVDSTPSE
jgi:hypothetical protein